MGMSVSFVFRDGKPALFGFLLMLRRWFMLVFPLAKLGWIAIYGRLNAGLRLVLGYLMLAVGCGWCLMVRYGDSGLVLVLKGETQPAPGGNSSGVLGHDQMRNMDVRNMGCRGYVASRMTEAAGAKGPVSLRRSNEKSQAENFGAATREAQTK